MTPIDRRNYYKAGAMEAQRQIDAIRKARQRSNNSTTKRLYQSGTAFKCKAEQGGA